jgi:hypothetical protein
MLRKINNRTFGNLMSVGLNLIVKIGLRDPRPGGDFLYIITL